MSLRRAVLGSSAALAAAVAVTGATAFACIAPATLNLSTAVGRPGDVITVTGSSFNRPANAPTGVQIRWGSTDGRVLAEVVPDAMGTFSTTVTVPDGPPGFYSVAAVLRDADGNDAPGTPGRALFEIRNPVAAPPPEPVVRTFTPSAGSSGSAFPLALVIGLGGLGLVLFAGGFLAISRSRRPSSAPAAERVGRN